MDRRSVVGCVLLVLGMALPVSSARRDIFIASDTPEALKGVPGLSVLLENLDKDAEEDGLLKSDLQTDVELKLRQSGIKILTKDERFKVGSGSTVVLNVNAKKHKQTSLYAFSIDLVFEEDVLLTQNPKRNIIGAITWRIGSTGYVGMSNLDRLRSAVKDHVDKFCNEYLTANPKK